MRSANQTILTYSGLRLECSEPITPSQIITYTYTQYIYNLSTILNLYATEAVSNACMVSMHCMIQLRRFTRTSAAEHFLRFLLFCDV